MENLKRSHSKLTLLARLINRWGLLQLKDVFNKMRKKSIHLNKRVSRMTAISQHNRSLSIHFAWLKMKNYALLIRQGTKTLNSVFILARRMEQHQLKKGFSCIVKSCWRNKSLVYAHINHYQKQRFCKLLINLLKETKAKAFRQLTLFNNFFLKYRPIKRILLIFNSIMQKNKLFAIKNLLKSSLQRHIMRMRNDHLLQVQDFKAQIANKKETIRMLEQRVKNRRMATEGSLLSDSMGKSFFSINQKSEDRNSSERREKSNSSHDLSEPKHSYYSRHSSLGKSNRESSQEQNGSFEDTQYKAKFIQSKEENKSLKHKLKILKQQLSFTRNLNSCFKDEIQKQLFDHVKEGSSLDDQTALHKQIQQLTQQKNILQAKLVKYKKYIQQIARQFKSKMQNVYRRAKKQN